MPLIELSIATFILLVIVALIIKFIWWIMKIIWKNFKITWFDTLLAIEFIIACGVVVYVVGDMIANARPITFHDIVCLDGKLATKLIDGNYYCDTIY